MTETIAFVLNGEHVTIENPSPGRILVDYLRSPAVGLTGAKKACGRGDCGACAVLLSEWHDAEGRYAHRSVNSCLQPLCAVDGLAVTTIEGIRDNPIAYRLAMHNGVRCGYCSPGFVMTMCGLLTNRSAPDRREIGDVFDGNVCRCTGYRPILTGMKTFAAEDGQRTMTCVSDEAVPCAELEIPLPPDTPPVRRPNRVHTGDTLWLRPATLPELGERLREYAGREVRLVNGNTSAGVYPGEMRPAEVLIDIQLIPELRGTKIADGWADVGASTTYTELIELLGRLRERRRGDRNAGENTALGALHLMARRTAGTLVRNAATVAGNTMLVLAHIEHGQPCVSDLLTAMVAVGAEVTAWWALTDEKPVRLPVAELIARVLGDRAALDGLVLVACHLPVPKEPIVLAQKVALREVDAPALVNAATSLRLTGTKVERAVVVYGGIAPYPWRAARTEDTLRQTGLSLRDFPRLAGILRAEVVAELVRWQPRMATTAWDGITDEYRVQLAVSLLYKAIVNALLTVAPASVPPAERSAGVGTWGRWPVSGGVQNFEASPLGQPYIPRMAFHRANGRVTFADDRAVPPRTVHAAFVWGDRAPGGHHFHLPGTDEPVEASALAEHLRQHRPGFVELITEAHVPDQGTPLFTPAGPAVALAVATTEQDAASIAAHISDSCIGQAPGYPATRVCIVEPIDGDRWRVTASGRNPMATRETAGLALGVPYHRIDADVAPAAGDAAGPARFAVAAAMVAANALGRPVRLVAPGEIDDAPRTMITECEPDLSDDAMRAVWDRLAEVCDHTARDAEIEQFNRANRWRKRGMAMVPGQRRVAGSAPATVRIQVHPGDGSVVIHSDGVDTGQGVVTRIGQLASSVLGVPFGLVHVRLSDTGGAYSATAVEQACQELRSRLAGSSWPDRVRAADEQGVGLAVSHTAPPGADSVAYSAACSVAEVDVLTGEVTVLRSDLVHGIGHSVNPALDIGALEGAFVRGIGNVLTENLVCQPGEGRLNTEHHYLPAVTTIPLELNTYLLQCGPDGPAEVGESPVELAGSVYLAVQAAIRASRRERGLDDEFRLDVPATVQAVRQACEVDLTG